MLIDCVEHTLTNLEGLACASDGLSALHNPRDSAERMYTMPEALVILVVLSTIQAAVCNRIQGDLSVCSESTASMTCDKVHNGY